MHSGNFFEWLGSLIGSVIRGIVRAVQFVFGGFGHAISDFTDGLARSLGIHASVFNMVLLVIGLLLLAAGVKAFTRRAIVAGIVWTALAALLLGKLIAH